MANIYERHKNHWKINGETEKEEYLNEAIENFNNLVDNLLTPSTHRVKCTKPFEYDINNKFEENILISDV